MGKQVKGWVPPEEDQIIEEKTSGWIPPDDDVIIEPVKKKDDPDPVIPSVGISASAEVGKPSAESTAKPTPTTRHIGRINNQVIVTKNAFNQEAEAKRAELQAIIDADPSKEEQVNADFKTFLAEREAVHNATMDKWINLYSEQFEKEEAEFQKEAAKAEFQENKITNPLTSLKTSVWSTFSKDLPSAAFGARALGRSTVKKIDEKAIEGMEALGVKPVGQETGAKIEEMFTDAVKLFTGSDGKASTGMTRKDAENKLIIDDIKSSINRSTASANDKKFLIDSLDKVKDGDFVDWVNYAASAVGTGIGQIPTSVATKGASSLVQQMGNIYVDSVQKIAQEQGLTIDEVIKQGKDDVLYPLVFGIGTGLLDAIGAKGVAGAVSKKQVMDSFRGRVLSVLKAGGKGAAVESGTEAAQGALEQIGIGKAAGKTWEQTLKEFKWDQVVEGALQGGIAGLFLGSGGRALSNTFDRITAKKIDVPTVVAEVKADIVPTNEASVEAAAAKIEKAIEDAPPTGVEPVADTGSVTPTADPAPDTSVSQIKPSPVTPTDENSGRYNFGKDDPIIPDADTTGLEGHDEISGQPRTQETTGGEEQGVPPVVEKQPGDTAVPTGDGNVEPGSGDVQPVPDSEGLQKSSEADKVDDGTSVIERIEKLDPYESQGYQLTQNTATKKLMLDMPERAKVAFDIMDFAKKVWPKDLTADMEKHPLAHVGQFFYGDANSVREWVDMQIKGERQDIESRQKTIDSLQAKPKQTKADKDSIAMWQESITRAESRIQEYKDALAKEQPTSETPQQIANRELDALAASGDISRDGKKVTILTEKGGREAKRIHEELQNSKRTGIQKNETGDSDRQGAPPDGEGDAVQPVIGTDISGTETAPVPDGRTRDNSGTEEQQGVPVVVDAPAQQGSEDGGGNVSTDQAPAAEGGVPTDTPPPTDSVALDESGDGEKTRTYRIAQRIFTSDANEVIKRGVREKGADYVPKGIEITDSEATSLIELYGNDKAELMVKDTQNGITGDTRTALAARLYEKLKSEGDLATDEATRAQKYDKAIDVALTSAEQLKEAGRQVNAAKIWKAITASEDMTVLAIEKENQRQNQTLIEPIQKEVRASKEQFDEQIRRLIAQKVTEGVEENLKRAKLITSEKRKKIIETFDRLKIKDVKGTANDITRVLGVAVWNNSIEAVKRAVLAGADVANAIQAGIDYIRENYQGDWDENQYRSVVMPATESLIADERTVEQKKVDKAMQSVQEQIATLEQKILDKDLSKKAPKQPKVDTPELQELRKKRNDLQKQLNKMRRDAIKANQIDADKIKTPKLKGKRKQDFINQVVDSYNEGNLTDDKFDQLYAKQLGGKELSSQDRQKIRELSKIVAQAEQFENVVRDDFSKENIAKYTELLDKAWKANDELNQYARQPSDVWNTLISIMQGNLLTPLSIVTNVYSNTALQPLRFTSTAIGGILDYSMSALAKIGLLSKSYQDRTIDLSSLQKGYFQGGWNGTLEGLMQLKSGPRADDRNLREINNQFSPVRAIARIAEGDQNMKQKVNDYIEGTLGVPAEVMFRLLNLGDKPFRRAAETARAVELAKLKGLKGQDAERFIMFPDPESAAEIRKAGLEATFQQESASAKFVQQMLTKLINTIGKTPVVGGPLKVLAKSQIPYVKTPWNIMTETLQYAAYPITGAIGLREIARGNKRTGSVLVGKAIVGAMVFTVAKTLFELGLLSWDEPYDQKAGKQKERRQMQYDNIPPNSLNVSAIQRGMGGDGFEIQNEDIWINYDKLGVMGLLFDNYSNNYFANIREKDQTPDQSEFYIDLITTAPRVMAQSLDQSFLKGTSSLLTALQDGGGYKTEKWLIDTSGAISSIILPNTIATVSKASDEFIRDTRDDRFVKQLQNTYKTKIFSGGGLPAKVNLWGEKITGQPKGRDKYAYYLFDVTKFKSVGTDNFKYKLYQEWKKDHFKDDWLPSIPQRYITYRKERIDLSPKDYEKLCVYIGEERAYRAGTLINSARFERLDREQKIDKLKDAYQEGGERGRKKFLREIGAELLTAKKLSQIGNF